ncbi:hypothetical protein [Tenacibaculum ascidiaceicola]|uniref:hypothetical protein n=1 Tax=Tenacibaculum ascidiaceicola TaxID=1699411 RepID=UPI003CE50734
MKKLYLIILIIPITINAQQKQKTEIQNYWFKQARLDLKNLHLEKAFSSSKFSYDVFPESDKGKKSLKLFDSLKTILRNKLTNDMYGDWKLKIFNRVKTESDRKHYERLGRFLRIKKDSISYYTNRRSLRSNKPTLSFKINFCELMNYFPSYSDIIHLNNEIWHYRIDSTKNRLIILDYGKLDNGKKNRTGNISHPSGYTYKRLK